MSELLFESIIEKEALENILALNQIKKYDKEIEKYTKEINEQKEEMISILKNEDIDETYVEKIYKYKNIINNIDGDNDRISFLQAEIDKNEERINEFQEKIIEVENELNNLKKEIFETNDPSRVIECQNAIENNNVRLNDLNDILNGLVSDNTPLLIEKEYLIAKNNDFDFNIPNYNKNDISCDLDKIKNEFDSAISKLDLPIRENIEFCQKKISNRELEIEKYLSKKREVINAFPNAVSIDLGKAYQDIDKLLCELGISCKCEKIDEKNIFDDEETTIDKDIENEPVEEKNMKEEMNFFATDDEQEPVKIEINDDSEEEIEDASKEVEENDTEEPVDQDDEIESVSYVLSDGESLSNIAEKVYPSKENWEAIYYYNKETIDNFLISNGLNSDFETIKGLADDTNIFAGIKLEIPTDYSYKK